jgi:nitroreductase
MKRETKAGKPGNLADGNLRQPESKSVMECIYARRAVRCFRPDPIPEEVIRQLLEAGRFAPCGGGAEPWRFGVIRDRPRKERLAKAAGEQTWIASAPVVLALCADLGKAFPSSEFAREVNDTRFGKDFISYTEQCPDSRAMAKFWANSVPLLPGVQINLAAVSFGLGACWVGYLDTDEASRILCLPEDIVCLYLMPIGYPAENPEPASRNELRSMVFAEEWGNDAGIITDATD